MSRSIPSPIYCIAVVVLVHASMCSGQPPRGGPPRERPGFIPGNTTGTPSRTYCDNSFYGDVDFLLAFSDPTTANGTMSPEQLGAAMALHRINTELGGIRGKRLGFHCTHIPLGPRAERQLVFDHGSNSSFIAVIGVEGQPHIRAAFNFSNEINVIGPLSYEADFLDASFIENAILTGESVGTMTLGLVWAATSVLDAQKIALLKFGSFAENYAPILEGYFTRIGLDVVEVYSVPEDMGADGLVEVLTNFTRVGVEVALALNRVPYWFEQLVNASKNMTHPPKLILPSFFAADELVKGGRYLPNIYLVDMLPAYLSTNSTFADNIENDYAFFKNNYAGPLQIPRMTGHAIRAYFNTRFLAAALKRTADPFDRESLRETIFGPSFVAVDNVVLGPYVRTSLGALEPCNQGGFETSLVQMKQEALAFNRSYFEVIGQVAFQRGTGCSVSLEALPRPLRIGLVDAGPPIQRAAASLLASSGRLGGYTAFVQHAQLLPLNVSTTSKSILQFNVNGSIAGYILPSIPASAVTAAAHTSVERPLVSHEGKALLLSPLPTHAVPWPAKFNPRVLQLFSTTEQELFAILRLLTRSQPNLPIVLVRPDTLADFDTILHKTLFTFNTGRLSVYNRMGDVPATPQVVVRLGMTALYDVRELETFLLGSPNSIAVIAFTEVCVLWEHMISLNQSAANRTYFATSVPNWHARNSTIVDQHSILTL